MCGIVGITASKEREIREAMETLVHRGPDQSGIYVDNDISLGHKRLSVIDLTERGKQPMHDSSNDFVIVYNGEIYNYLELREELVRSGGQFNTETDTEVLVEGYKKEGVEFFKKIRGMWALAIYDKKMGRVILSRDQFGIKPLFYTKKNQDLLFASELGAFKKFNLDLRPNTKEYYTFFNLGYFIAPDTCYKDIYSLRPGEVVTFDYASRELDKKILDFDETESDGNTLSGVLTDSVKKHYIADVPVGILFSGGNDSSLIAAISKKLDLDPIAYHMSIEGSTDTKYAEMISKQLNLKSEIIPFTKKELIKQYSKIWDNLDTPFADISIIPTTLIYNKIKGKTKVILSGEGGDEWFGGYLRHQNLARHKKITKNNILLKFLNYLYGTRSISVKFINPILLRLKSLYLNHFAQDVVGAYIKEVKLIDYPIEEQKLRNKLYELYVSSKNKEEPKSLFYDRTVYLPDDLLFKTDNSSMSSSVEARVPFIDKEVVSYIQNKISPEKCLSSKYKNKFLLKKVLEEYLPKNLVHRDKKGFSFSFEKYDIPGFRDDLDKAITFHHTHAESFDLESSKKLLKNIDGKTLIKKYPRFAFALVSNWKIFEPIL